MALVLTVSRIYFLQRAADLEMPAMEGPLVDTEEAVVVYAQPPTQ
jgi:hypothetical protein